MKFSVQPLLGLLACAVVARAQIVAKPMQVLDESVGIISAELAVVALNLTAPFCTGVVDLLPVTFTFPVVGAPMPQDFDVTVGTLAGEVRDVVSPFCATLMPAGEDNERRTVLLAGEFTPTDDVGPIAIAVVGNLLLDVNGAEASAAGSSIASPSGDFFSKSGGPRVVDFEFIDLLPPPPAFNATNDPNGCAALFPDATYTIRLIFSAGVRQKTDGALEDLGVNSTPERAAEFFSLSAFGVDEAADRIENDVILGIADTDPDNVVDLCVQSIMPLVLGQQSTLVVNCDGDDAGIIFDPAGDPCQQQMVMLPSVTGGPVSFEFATEGATAETGMAGGGADGGTSSSGGFTSSSSSSSSSSSGDGMPDSSRSVSFQTSDGGQVFSSTSSSSSG